MCDGPTRYNTVSTKREVFTCVCVCVCCVARPSLSGEFGQISESTESPNQKCCLGPTACACLTARRLGRKIRDVGNSESISKSVLGQFGASDTCSNNFNTGPHATQKQQRPRGA